MQTEKVCQGDPPYAGGSWAAAFLTFVRRQVRFAQAFVQMNIRENEGVQRVHSWVVRPSVDVCAARVGWPDEFG